MGDPSAVDKLEWLRVAARFAWPAAFVVAVGILATAVRDRPAADAQEVRVHPSSTVVKSLRELARLETTSLHVEKVIDVKDHQKRVFGLVESDDALLFVASGEVVIGVDLSKLRDEDARFDEATKTASITLPEPEVLTTRFDEIHSHVHARQTDVLARRNEQLEAIARRDAIAAFEAAGRDKAATSRAKDQAEKQLRALGTAWGAREVKIAWRPVAAGELTASPARP
jgi:Protein of unknown function (DUF4230)